MFAGLSLGSTSSMKSLAVSYLAAIQGVAYEAREIWESLKSNGHDKLNRVHICGGLAKNELFVQTHADVFGVDFVCCGPEVEPVLLGGAMMAKVAAFKGGHLSNNSQFLSKSTTSMEEIISEMKPKGTLIKHKHNSKKRIRDFHDKKFAVFKKLRDAQTDCRKLMMAGAEG